MLDDVAARPCRPVFPTDSVPLTFLGMRRSVFEMLGGFDEGFRAGGENDDFVLRAMQRGYVAAVVNNALIYHRRMFFRNLGSCGLGSEIAFTQKAPSQEHWHAKWGPRRPIEVYREIRYGYLAYQCLRPVFAVVRVVKFALRWTQGRK